MMMMIIFNIFIHCRFYTLGGNHRAVARRELIEELSVDGNLPEQLLPLLSTQAQIVINPNKEEALTVIFLSCLYIFPYCYPF